MIGVLFILIATIGTTAAWLVNRWVIRNDGRGDIYGFWSTVSAAVFSGVVALLLHQLHFTAVSWLISGMIAVAYGVGYFIVIMHCMKIGPTGPTVAMNNMGIVWAVILGALVFKPHPLTLLTIVGLVMVASSLVLFGFSRKSAQKTTGISMKWLGLALVGWMFAGMSATGQYLGSLDAPGRPFTVVFGMNTLTAVILLPVLLSHRAKWGRAQEIVGGVVNGAIVVVTLGAMLSAFSYYGPEVVFPFAQALPIVLVTILGRVLYGEKLDLPAWVASGVGVAGLTLVLLSQSR